MIDTIGSNLEPLRKLLRLAVPITITRLGFMAFGITDVLTVSRLMPQETAFQAVGTGILLPVLLIGIGLLHAVSVFVARAVGEQNPEKACSCFQLGFVYALLYGCLCVLLALFPVPVLSALKLEPLVVSGASPIFQVIAVSIAFQLLFTVPANFLEAINRPIMVMTTIVIANLVNLFLNIWLVGGGLGLPPMGAMGSAWSTLLVRILAFVALFLWVLYGPPGQLYHLRLKKRLVFKGLDQREFFRVGFFSSVSQGVESLAFSAMLVFSGWISSLALSAFNIAFTVLGLLFMLPLGVGVAASVLVGNALGEGRKRQARSFAFMGLQFNFFLMFMFTLVFFRFNQSITVLLTSDPQIASMMLPLIGLSGFIMMFDGGQAIMSLCVRATSDSFVPTLIYLFSYGFLMILSACILVFRLDFGVSGLYYSILLASVVSVILVSLRFHHLTRLHMNK